MLPAIWILDIAFTLLLTFYPIYLENSQTFLISGGLIENLTVRGKINAANLTCEVTPYLETVITRDCFSSKSNAALIFYI